MQLENIIALSMGIPTLLLAIYGVARRNKTGQSKHIATYRSKLDTRNYTFTDDFYCNQVDLQIRMINRCYQPIRAIPPIDVRRLLGV
jgi:hypothetical protein